MQVRKAVAGSVIGGSMVAMAVVGMGSASASVAPGHGQNGQGGDVSVTNISHSYNTVTKTTSYDDHSINTALFSNNTTSITVKLNVLNGNKIANGNKLFSGNKTPILNGLKLLNGSGNTHN